MTTPSYPDNPGVAGLSGSTSKQPSSSQSSASAKEQTKQAAGTAADEGKHVAGVAQGEAQRVASEAKSQARDLLSQAGSQVDEQSRTQRDRLVGTLSSFGEDLEKMAAGSEGGLAADVARQVADRARSLSSHLDGREPRELLDDVRGFARRRPGTFLLGALAAGVVAGRLTRGAKDAQSSGAASSAGWDTAGTAPTTTVGTTPGLSRAADVTSPGDPLSGGLNAPSSGPISGPETQGAGTATGDPLAGVDAPISDPVYPEGSDPAAGPGGVRP